MNNECSVKNFWPLITIFSLILLFAILRAGMNPASRTVQSFMYDFMGAFFIVFGCFKIANLPAFARAYSMYDFIAQQTIAYAYVYPFVELVLGICYLMRWQLLIVNLVTLGIMLLGSASVAWALWQEKKITCACLGVLFSLPMTYVSLLEDLLMALMAAVMLFW